MNRFTKCVFASLPLAAVLFAAPALAQTEAEPNNTIAQANGPFTVGAAIQGTYASASDADFFAIVLPAQMNLNLAIWGPTIGVCPIAVDPVLEVFNSAGVSIAWIDDTEGRLCPEVRDGNTPSLQNLPAGVYYVKVSQLGVGSNANYTLVTYGTSQPVPQAEQFTYQGVLETAGLPVNGNKRMTFSLWSDAESTLIGNQLGGPLQVQSLAITDGKFTVGLDFTNPMMPSQFNGTERYLQIEVADVGGANSVILSPRQRLSPSPHAIHSLHSNAATTAENATLATRAINSDSATYAQFAYNAGTASTAESIPWNAISGKPAGFADGFDDTGDWEVGLNSTRYNGYRVGIGTNDAASFMLAVAGTAAKTGGGSWAVFSDARLKHDIVPLTGTLDRLLQLKGYTYEYNADAVEHRLALPGKQIGLLAQEVQQVFPDWVETDADGYLYVTERATTALMVEGLRDLRNEKDRQIESLRAENASLNARLERLERQLSTKP